MTQKNGRPVGGVPGFRKAGAPVRASLGTVLTCSHLYAYPVYSWESFEIGAKKHLIHYECPHCKRRFARVPTHTPIIVNIGVVALALFLFVVYLLS